MICSLLHANQGPDPCETTKASEVGLRERTEVSVSAEEHCAAAGFVYVDDPVREAKLKRRNSFVYSLTWLKGRALLFYGRRDSECNRYACSHVTYPKGKHNTLDSFNKIKNG